MKRLVISAVVGGLICAAGLWASTLSLSVSIDGEPYDGSFIPIGTQVDVKVVQDAPNPDGTGGEITITMYASGGAATDTTPIVIPGTYGDWPWIVSLVGFDDNGDGTWTAWMNKIVGTGTWTSGTPGIGTWYGVPGYSGWAYESTMEFYFITSETTDLIIEGTWDDVSYDDACTCYGDVTDDGEVSIADLSAIVGLLSPAYAGTTPPYTACPPPEGWECADITGDGCISIADLSALSGYLNPAYAGTTPPYTGPCMPSP